MSGTAPVVLAVVGHTNAGKTSLLRSLSRDTAFGEVSDRPATTREVRGMALLADGQTRVSLYDTPGLEDAIGLAGHLSRLPAGFVDPVARIEHFLAGDHDQGRYEQEAKVLRQMLASDAALYVIDAREPVLAKHRQELRLLAECGRPLLPLLNFVAGADADVAAWRTQLAREGLHVLAEFDTVVYDAAAEREVFDKLATLLHERRADLQALVAARAREREALLAAAARAIAELLINAAGARQPLAAHGEESLARSRLQTRIVAAEQSCVETLLALFRFELGAYAPPELPLREGRWQLDPFDPETLRVLGIRTGSAAAAGGAAGLAVDAMTGGLSLGAAALLGAGLGAAWSASGSLGREWLGRIIGRRTLAVNPETLAVLASRQTQLLAALLRRGHAAQAPVRTGAPSGWPSAAVREAVLRARAHPEWSALNGDAPEAMPEAALRPLAHALRQLHVH